MQRVPLSTCPDLGDPILQARIQAFFDSQGSWPPLDSPDEYSAYFEAAYPSEGDRRNYIDYAVQRATPALGFAAMAELMKLGAVKIVYTTNFDRLLEDAAVAAFGSSAKLTVATLGAAELGLQALNEGRFPLYVKLHGDFVSRRLKNTNAELQLQDATLRRSMLQAAQRFGMIVAGYSGRDESIMDSLSEAIESTSGFPNGLFWLHRAGSTILPRVEAMLSAATSRGIEAALIEISTFDELVVDLIYQRPDAPASLQQHFSAAQSRMSEAPESPKGSKNAPVLRLNALPVLSYPSSFRLINCDIGGTADVRKAIAATNRTIFAARRRGGVIAIGADEDLKETFSPYGIKEFLLQPIDHKSLREDGAEIGVLLEALSQGLAGTELDVSRRRGRTILIVKPDFKLSERFAALRLCAGVLAGIVPRAQIPWAEACQLRLWPNRGALWLLLRPTVHLAIGPDTNADDEDKAKTFTRERQAIRYNNKQNEFLGAWTRALQAIAADGVVNPLPKAASIDVTFKLGSVTAFSRKLSL